MPNGMNGDKERALGRFGFSAEGLGSPKRKTKLKAILSGVHLENG